MCVFFLAAKFMYMCYVYVCMYVHIKKLSIGYYIDVFPQIGLESYIVHSALVMEETVTQQGT